MGTLIQQGDQFIESEQPADNGYGQNGYSGPSSDLPGQRTTSGFLPEMDPKMDLVTGRFKDDGWQTRKVSDQPLAAAHGTRHRESGGTIPTKNTHPVKR